MISNDRIKYSEYTEYTEYVRNHCFSTKNVYLGLRTLFLELDVTRDDSSSSSVSSAPRLLGVVLVRTAAAGEGVMGAAAPAAEAARLGRFLAGRLRLARSASSS